jgi:phosphatidylserine/phosphatidylglycerophosphate/cardiolipin synthase-like enzyme
MRSPLRIRWLFLGLLLLGSGWYWSQRPSRSAPKSTPLPQDPQIQVYFNHNPSTSYLEPYRPVQRSGDDLEAMIIQEIDRATQSIDIAVQEIRLPRIAKALAKRQQVGIAVRVILENKYHRSVLTASEAAQLSDREKSRYQEFIKLVDTDRDGQLSSAELDNRDALKILANAGIPILDDTADGSQGSGLMHHKFMTIDGQRTLVTSANWTLSDIHGDLSRTSTRGNANNLLVIASPAVAEVFRQEFNLMWGDGPGGAANSLFQAAKPDRPPVTIPLNSGQITIHFSPAAKTLDWSQTSNGAIAQTLSQAQVSTSLALFVFSEPQLSSILETSHQRGVQISALIDRDFAYRPYSQLLSMLGVAACQPSSSRQPWASPISSAGVPDLPEGDLLHHKFAVIDKQQVITGSHNWSAAANYKNDETVLIIQNPQVAAHFQGEFDRLYSSATLGMPSNKNTCKAAPEEN